MDKVPPPSLPGLKLLARLGQGGMGTVYKALDLKLQRTVAVKVLSAELAGDAAFSERFLREARYLARLRHANLVTIYDVVTAEATPYLVMEYVEGGTLGRRLSAQGRMPWAEAKPLLEQVLAAVSAIHAAGLVHRDLKPGNILLDAAGRVKVMDFGLAKDASEAALTQEGMILGTPEYMSPEQARGDAITPAADVYALGVIAYEMLSGKPPFKGPSTVATLRMQCQDEPPPLSAVSPDVPVEVQAWVRRTMAKAPAARFKDAAEMRGALGGGEGEAAPEEPTTIAAPVSPALPRRAWVAWAGVATVLLLAAALFRRHPAVSPFPAARLTLGGKALAHGSIVSIQPTEDGGHRVTLKVDGRDQAFDLPADQPAALEIEAMEAPGG